MSQNICNICGANYEYRNGRWICPACGAYKAEELSNEEVTLLYNAAQKLRLSDFDEAEKAYTDIIEKYPQNPNGYWGRLLSRYGIKYEEDFDGRKIPTCYAASIESVISDKDYNKALDLADTDTKAYFEQQAQYIERVRKEWIERAKKEKPYDIFICYKDSDLANGIDRTQDSIVAQELYIHLIEQGYRVFFSRESLRDKVGEKYEPYIFNALSTAKVMLVYGSSSEYITSTWLKNEWTRYEKRLQAGEKKPNSLIVACDGFSPAELPKVLSSMQCFDATSRSFYTDLDAVLKKIIKGEPKPKVSEPVKAKTNNKKISIAISLLSAFLAILLCVLIPNLISDNSGLTSLTNTQYNASVVLNSGEFSKDTVFKVEELIATTQIKSVISSLSVNQSNYHVYDMSLHDKKSEVDVEGSVVVTMPLPANINASKAVVYYISGNLSDEIASSVLDGKISFTTSHFSIYVIAEKIESVTPPDNEDNPKYTITFDSNGGSGTMNSISMEINTTINLPANVFTRAGYTFMGWSDVPNGDVIYGNIQSFKMTSASNVTLYAVWSADTKTISFNANGGSGLMSDQTGKTGETITLRDNTFTRNGYTFAGWATSTDGPVVYTNQANYTIGESYAQSVILYAVWEDNINSIVFNANGGSGSMTAQQAKTDEKVTLKQNSFTRTGYTFKGWSTTSGGIVVYADQSEYTMETDEAVTLYAVWEAISYMATFKNDSTIIAEIPFTVETTSLVEPSVPARQCYIGAWSDYEIIANDIIVYAEYTLSHSNIVKVDAKEAQCNATGNIEYWHCSGCNGNYTTQEGTTSATNTTLSKVPCEYVNGACKWCGSSGSPIEHFTFEDFGNATYVLTGYIGEDKTVVIPATYQGKPITAIADNAFKNCVLVERIWLNNNITSIGVSAFENCIGLKSIVLSTKLTDIGGYAFRACSALEEIEIPSTVISIGYAAFKNCTKLDNVVIPNGVEEIQTQTFYGCSSLENLILSEGIKSIDYQAFQDCIGLKHLVIPESVNEISFEGILNGCSSLETLIIPQAGMWVQGPKCYPLPFIFGTTVYDNSFEHKDNYIYFPNGIHENMIYGAPTQICYIPNSLKAIYIAEGKTAFNRFFEDIDTVEVYWNYVYGGTKIDFDHNDSNVTPNTYKFVKQGEAYTFNVPTREGYVFAGWYNDNTQITGSDGVTLSEWSISTDCTLTAKWNPASYTVTYEDTTATRAEVAVTFDYNYSGSTSSTVTLTNGQTLSRPTNPTRNGYVFTGWYTTSDCTTRYEFSGTIIDDMTLYAGWLEMSTSTGYSKTQINPSEHNTSSNCYRVFTDNTRQNGPIFIYLVAEEDGLHSIFFKNSVVYFEYGYYIHIKNLTTDVSIQGRVLVNITSFAKAPFTCSKGDVIEICLYQSSEDDSTAYFYFDGFNSPTKSTAMVNLAGDGIEYKDNSNCSISVSYDAYYTLPIPTRTGYTFEGWYSGDTKMESGIWNITNNVTLTPKWTANTYTITFDANGGECDTSSQKVVFDESYTAPTPTRKGYTFAGWFNGSTQYTSGTWLGTADLDLTAKWDIVTYDISYTMNGGTISGNKTSYNAETETFTLPTPEKEDYIFLGWSGTGILGVQKTVTVTKGSTGDRTYTANWELNAYTITLDANGGSVSTSEATIHYGSNYSIPIAKRPGYIFLGWYGGTSSNANVYTDGNGNSLTAWNKTEGATFYAQWQVDFSEGLNYKLLEGWVNSRKVYAYEVSGIGTCTDTVIKLPSEIDGIPVIGVGESAFSGNINITSVIFPTELFDDGYGAREMFSRSEGYSSNGLYIKGGAFYNCSNLESVVFGKVVGIGVSAFNGCTKLYSVDIDVDCPLHTINGWAFSGCTSLQTIIIPSECTKIDMYAFAYCTNLTIYCEIDSKPVGWDDGWNMTSSYDGEWHYSYFTVYWGYLRNGYKVELDYDGATGNNSVTYRFVELGNSYILPVPTKTGYTFAGWYYGNTQVTNASGVTLNSWSIDSNCTLKADWAPATNTAYTVKHLLENANDNGYTLQDTEELYGTTGSSVSPSTQTYTGFNAPSKASVTILPDGSAVLEYRYTRTTHTITFVTNGGDTIDTMTVKYQQTVTMPTTTREGFTFGGWFTDIALTNEFQGNITSNTTLYAWWEEETKPNVFTYSGAEEITISGYVGTESELVIPAFIGGSPVVTIGENAFFKKNVLQSIVIPDTVTWIGEGAFKGCEILEDITLPFVGNSDSATDKRAVFGFIFGSSCSIGHLNARTISTTYENEAYGTAVEGAIWQYSCRDYMMIDNVGSKYYQSSYYYYIPTSIKTVTITMQTSVPVAAFNNCDFIETIYLPEELTIVRDYAFYNCTGLSVICFDGTAEQWKDIEREQKWSNGTHNYIIKCSNCEIPYVSNGLTYELSNSGDSYIVAGIGSCTDTAIVIPSTYEGYPVQKIGDKAFQSCSTIIYIEIPHSVTTIGESAFYGCDSLVSVSIVPGLESIGNNAFELCENLNKITLPDTVRYIGNAAFNGCKSLNNVTLSNALISIGNDAFRMTGIKNIKIPASVIRIGWYAFEHSLLENVEFENPNNWWYSDNENATNGTNISSEMLNSPATAATYLKSYSYYTKYYWRRGE